MRPYIDSDSVLLALEHIARAELLPRHHVFYSLFLVRARLQSPEHLDGEYASLFSIAELLREIVLDKLGVWRETDDDITETLRYDFTVNEPHTTAYAIIYYLYLRSDLGLSIDQLGDLVGLVSRSIRRRRLQAADLLTMDIIERETRLRRQHLNAVLASRIPVYQPPQLYGRQALLTDLLETLAQTGTLMLVGMPGIGKRTLGAAMARWLLPQYDNFFWISLNAGQSILQQISSVLEGLPGTLHERQSTLPSYFQLQRVLLVLQAPSERHIQELREAGWLNDATLILISTEFFSDWAGATYRIPEMDQGAAQDLFDAYRGDLPAGLFDKAYHHLGGNPGALLEYLNIHRLTRPGGQLARMTLFQHFRDVVYPALALPHKQVWMVACLLEPQPISENWVALIAPNHVRALADLAAKDVLRRIDSTETVYRLSDAARSFMNDELQQLMFQAESVKGHLDAFAALDVPVSERGRNAQHLIHMLLQGMLNLLSYDVQEQIIWGQLSEEIPFMGLWDQWSQFIAQCEIDVEQTQDYGQLWRLLFEKARLARWFGQLADSQNQMQHVIRHAGETGNFYLYGRGLLELARLYAQREAWSIARSAAHDALPHLRNAAERKSAELVILRARIALGESTGIDEYLSSFRVDWPAEAISAAEIALLAGFPARAQTYAQRAIDACPLESALLGRSYATLARAYFENGQIDEARDAQQRAINILSMTTDLIGLARAYNNLGVIFYELSRDDQASISRQQNKARKAWEKAQQILLSLQDATALQVIRTNLSMLGGKASQKAQSI